MRINEVEILTNKRGNDYVRVFKTSNKNNEQTLKLLLFDWSQVEFMVDRLFEITQYMECPYEAFETILNNALNHYLVGLEIKYSNCSGDTLRLAMFVCSMLNQVIDTYLFEIESDARNHRQQLLDFFINEKLQRVLQRGDHENSILDNSIYLSS